MLAVVGQRCRGNGCPARITAYVPARRARFGSSRPWPVAVPSRPRLLRSGLVGSSHRAILWSLRCHTFPTPGRKAWAATLDHRGGCLVSGDVGVGTLPMLGTPETDVGGIDRQQLDTDSVAHTGQPVAEHCGRDPDTVRRNRFPRAPRPMVSRPSMRASAKSRSATAIAAMWWRRV